MFLNPFCLPAHYCRVVAPCRLSKQRMLSDAGRGKKCNVLTLDEDRDIPGNKTTAC